MSWDFTFRKTYLFDQTSISVRLPIPFDASHRFIVRCQPLTGVGENERFLGSLQQLLFIPGIGEVKGDDYSLLPAYKLFFPSTEFDFRLQYFPLVRLYSVEISVWIDSELFTNNIMPISNPSAPNYPVSTAANSTTVASSITSVAILAANTTRKGAAIWNASTATLFLDLDAAATITDYAAKLDPGGYYEVPFGYTGALSGIWSAANGNALVREFV